MFWLCSFVGCGWSCVRKSCHWWCQGLLWINQSIPSYHTNLEQLLIVCICCQRDSTVNQMWTRTHTVLFCHVQKFLIIKFVIPLSLWVLFLLTTPLDTYLLSHQCFISSLFHCCFPSDIESSSLYFVLQLLGAAFLGIGLWAWAEKVSINTCTVTNTVEVQPDCNSIAEVLPPYSGRKILEVHLAGKNLD